MAARMLAIRLQKLIAPAISVDPLAAIAIFFPSDKIKSQITL